MFSQDTGNFSLITLGIKLPKNKNKVKYTFLYINWNMCLVHRVIVTLINSKCYKILPFWHYFWHKMTTSNMTPLSLFKSFFAGSIHSGIDPYRSWNVSVSLCNIVPLTSQTYEKAWMSYRGFCLTLITADNNLNVHYTWHRFYIRSLIWHNTNKYFSFYSRNCDYWIIYYNIHCW